MKGGNVWASREFWYQRIPSFLISLNVRQEIVKEAAWQLVALTEDFTNVKEKRHAIEKLEHKGDQVTHDIYEQLNRTFITPLEPEEISRLASTLDEVLDYIDGSAEKMFYYTIESTDSPHDRTGKTDPPVSKRDRKCSEKYPIIKGSPVHRRALH